MSAFDDFITERRESYSSRDYALAKIAFNAGLERAVEIAGNKYDSQYGGYTEAGKVIANAIRKEIK